MPNPLDIQALITEGKVITSIAAVDPTQVFVQVGVYNPDARRIKAVIPNAYKPFVIPLSQLGGGGPPVVLPVDNKRFIHVDARFGTDSTAQKYNEFLPFQSMNAAITAAVPGDLIIVEPGEQTFSYFVTVNMFKPGVNYYFRKGVIMNVFTVAQADTYLSNVYYFLTLGPGFAVGETVTNGLGGVGTISEVSSSGYVLISVSAGTFNGGDTITGGSTGTQGTVYFVDGNVSSNISILGYGDIRFYAYTLLGGEYNGTFTMEADYITYFSNSFYGGNFSGHVNINALIKMTLGAGNTNFFWDNLDYYPTSTRPNDFNITANDVEVGSGGSIFALWRDSVKANFNFKKYRYNGAGGQFGKEFQIQGTTGKLYEVGNTINIYDFFSDKSLVGYSDSSFFFLLGNSSTKTFITGNYTYLGNGIEAQLPALFQTSGSQTLFVDANITVIKGSVFVDLNSDGNVEIAGNVFVDNSAVGFMEYLFAAYFISGANVRILANTRMINAFNPIVQIGTYTIALTPEVDIVNCQLVNEDASGTAFAVIGKSFDGCPSCGGYGPYPNLAPYGILRIVNTRIVTQGLTSIEGVLGDTAELVTVYSNKTTVNILNSVPAMPGLFVDAGLTAAGF